MVGSRGATPGGPQSPGSSSAVKAGQDFDVYRAARRNDPILPSIPRLPLAEQDSVRFLGSFHVETFRGGMNRLLLRAMPTEDDRERIEVLFQYVQRLAIPMDFGVSAMKRGVV